MSNQFSWALKKGIEYNRSILDFMNNICEPLNAIGIHYFYHVKIYNDSTRYHVTNNLNFLNLCLNDTLMIDLNTNMKQRLLNVAEDELKYVLWTGAPKDSLQQLLFDMNIWNGFTIFKKRKTCLDIWGFGAKKEDTEMPNFYINNIPLLEKFTLSFREKSRKLIDLSKKKLIIPPLLNSTGANIKEKTKVSMSNTSFNYQKIRRYFFSENNYLSRREFECLESMQLGKTQKEIANILNISSRTIEQYIEKIKEKTNYHARSSLIEFYLRELTLR